MGKLLVIAGTSGPFSDFGSYAPSINNEGVVAFQATRRSGATGAFCGKGGPISPLAFKATYTSHPDINDAGELAIFATLPDSTPALLKGAIGAPPEVVAHEAIATIGPLGPTINQAGAVAFRAQSTAGRAGIYLAGRGAVTRIAETGEQFSSFDGLPLVLDGGDVVFRATHVDGSEAVHRWHAGLPPECIAATGTHFSQLGRFPSANALGTVVVTASRADGTHLLLRASAGRVDTLLESGRAFESFRGACVDDAGRIALLATPTGGELAVYAMDGDTPRRVIGLRDDFGTCALTDFAINPVSFNSVGQIALRLRLADGRQFIARLDVF